MVIIMRKRFKVLFLSTALLLGMAVTGCGKSEPSAPIMDVTTKEIGTEKTVENVSSDTVTENTTESVTEEPATTEPVTEEPVTTEPVTEEPTTEYISTYSLLMSEELKPRKSGYAELDVLIDNVFSEILTDDMNNYTKVWTSYLYLVDNVTYSRGMDANTGAYSASSPENTPTEILWATDLLNTKMGCCYNYSATFVFFLRALGYDAYIVSGNVPAYNGGVTPHCWVLVNLGGKQFTFDPDLDMNYFTRGDCETKDWWFGRSIDEVAYFYKAEKIHEI